MEGNSSQENETNKEARKTEASRYENEEQLGGVKLTLPHFRYIPRVTLFFYMTRLCPLKTAQQCQNYDEG